MHTSRAASQEGFGLVEVVVSAAVLVIVVLGVLAGLDGVTRAAGNNKARTVAATLAEKDQERLRSYRTTDLNNLEAIEAGTRTVEVDGTPYTITSEARWISDGTGEDISCALDGDRGSYLRIISSVTVPGVRNPVVLSSIVAPQPGKGTLTGKVENAAGLPVVAMAVQATGATPGTKQTNEAGCAVFNERDAGSYVLRLNTLGWVDPSGNPSPQKSGTVSAGNLTTVDFVYDRAFAFAVATRTIRPPATTAVADASAGVIAAHTGMPTGVRLVTPTAPATTATSFAFTSMFPFTTPYQVYAGTCTGADPSRLTGNSTYFANHPEAVTSYGPALVVYEPTIDVYVQYTRSSGTIDRGNARVYAYPKSPDCPTTRITLGTTSTASGATWAAGEIPLLTGLPFGVYDVCADFTTGSGTIRKRSWTDVSNSNPNGTALSAALNSSSTAGACGTTTP
jgi:type II secretory pathway pseudopilin PulG